MSLPAFRRSFLRPAQGMHFYGNDEAFQLSEAVTFPRVSENRGLDFATRKQAENSQFEKDLITQENEINNNEAATEIIR